MQQILVIDDDPMMAQVYRAELEKHFLVHWCADAQMGIGCLEQYRDIAAIVLDLMMPPPLGIDASITKGGKRTGLWVLRAIREQLLARKIPVFILTGGGLDDVEMEVLDIGLPAEYFRVGQKLDISAVLLPKEVEALLSVVRKHVPAAAAAPVMCIMSVATEWFSRHGGVSTFNREMCCALARCGHNVVCLVPSTTPEELESAAANRVMLISSECGSGVDPTVGLFRPPRLPDGFSPDVVIGHGRVTGFAARAQVEYFKNAARVQCVHVAPGEIEWYKGKDNAAEVAEYREEEERQLCLAAQLIVAVGPRLAREAGNLMAGVSPRRDVHRCDPGLDSFPPREPPPGIQCLVLGRAEDADLKGLDIVARAMAKLPHPYPRPLESAPILVIRGAPRGAGAALRSRLLALSQKPGLDIRVREYTADVESIRSDLQRASLLLMPSRAEGFGLVGLEAISAGTPILVSDKSGLGELLREKLQPYETSLFVVETTGEVEADSTLWANLMEHALRDRSAAFRRARWLNRELSSRLNWDAAMKSLLPMLATCRHG